jgi:hypothetical protein
METSSVYCTGVLNITFSVTALGYGLDDRGVRVPGGAGNCSLHHRVQTGYGLFAGGRASGA